MDSGRLAPEESMGDESDSESDRGEPAPSSEGSLAKPRAGWGKPPPGPVQKSQDGYAERVSDPDSELNSDDCSFDVDIPAR